MAVLTALRLPCSRLPVRIEALLLPLVMPGTNWAGTNWAVQQALDLMERSAARFGVNSIANLMRHMQRGYWRYLK